MIKKLTKRLCRGLGLDVSLVHNERLEENRVHAVLRKLNLKLVVDVGANTGHFGQALFKVGYQGRLISFEPLIAEHAKLKHEAGRFANWLVAPRCALGDRVGELPLYRAGNSASSSLLPMMQKHVDEVPASRLVGEELVPICRLDECTDIISSTEPLFLKLDTQGYELRVLQGATAVLPRIRAVLLETSIVPLYVGCPLIADVMQALRGYGFVVVDLNPAFWSCDGQMLQVNLIAVREEFVCGLLGNQC